MTTNQQVVMPQLHPGQQAVHDAWSTYRFQVLAASRQWRKTSYGVSWCMEGAMTGDKCLIVAPIYKQALVAWDMLRSLALQIPGVTVNKTEYIITFHGGGLVQIRSAEDPDSLRGPSWDRIVLDEAAQIAERAWTEALRPTITTRRGKVLFISTFSGRNWFWELWSNAPDREGWKSWVFPWYTVEHLTKEEIDNAEATTPEDVFKQEYLCVPMDRGGVVFRNVEACVYEGGQQEPQEGHKYIAGLDLAKFQDFTVLTVADWTTKRVVKWERWNQVDWAVTKPRVQETIRKYNGAKLWMDSTGVGEPIFEDLKRLGLDVEAYHMTAQSKRALVDALILSIEQEKIRYPREPVLLDEMKAFQYELTKAGNLRTNAPSGYHDDAVTSLALCNWGLFQGNSETVEAVAVESGW